MVSKIRLVFGQKCLCYIEVTVINVLECIHFSLGKTKLEGFEMLQLIIVSIKLLKIFDLHFPALESSFVLRLRCVLNYSLTLIDCLPEV